MEMTSPPSDAVSTAWNRSDKNLPPHFDLENMILEILTVIFALIGMSGNIVVFCILSFCVNRNTISVYILNLAISDFLLLSCLFILHVWTFIGNFYYWEYRALLNVGLCFYSMGLFMLSAISFERCLAVLFPIWYHCHRPTYMSTVICTLFWALSLLFAILTYSCPFIPGNYRLCIAMNYTIGSSLIFDFVILCGSRLTLLVRMLCKARRLQLTRLYVTIGLTVLVFLFCGLPVGILGVLSPIIDFEIVFSSFGVLQQTSYFLSSINSSANPIIYFFVGSFRQKQQQQRQPWSLKFIFQKALEDVGEREKSGDSLPQENVEVVGSP
ncbi:mas-related G-protein coupled receptor member A6-like [Octodon degus]|uniref:Mas-related G-protein coupled receptor member A6-like n=1 Tax=Octodon degus TaxID=10160 RepID=A0A6P3EZ17_OCTDE|nr:mas-related G-protein coupled receptor member A6-like [Octodon degus]